MRRCGLRFGLLGPPVLYDRPPYEISYGSSRETSYERSQETSCERPYETPGSPSGEPEAHGTRSVPGGDTPDDTPDNGVRAIGSPKVRALLAALLLEAGRVVPVESLKDALWGGAPPVSAQASLHNHVTRLRRLLDDPERLRAVPPGYVLRVDHGELDMHVFDARVAEARAAHAWRDWAGVVRACTAGLALWRGAPLSGLPVDLGGYALVQRLEEARLLLLEWRYDAELSLGGARLAALVPELAALVAEYPLREAYHRQLMLALYRTGRQAEALAVHRDLRARLIEELGVEPGPAVREAHAEVLRGNGEGREQGDTGGDVRQQASAGDGRAGAAVEESHGDGREETEPAARQTPRPAQLPAPPAHFTGRADARRELWHALTEPPAPAPAIAVISGMAGVGKSALALYVAHELRERFTDGQLYVNLHGATPGMTPLTAAQALAALLRDLGTEPRSIPEHPDAAAALLRSLLAPARILLVLDDAANAAQVRPLLPAGPGCAVIVTSRSPLTALDGARRFPLTPLTCEDSAALLRAVSGRDGLGAGHALVELTGRLPLALRVVAARLAARRALTPDVLAGQLAETGGRLRHLEYDDLSVRRSLAVAHDSLAAAEREADRDAALALRRIGALDLPTYGALLIARLTGTDERRAEAALDRLVDVALLEETTYGRYAPHDLVRDFARELADSGRGAGAGVPGGVSDTGARERAGRGAWDAWSGGGTGRGASDTRSGGATGQDVAGRAVSAAAPASDRADTGPHQDTQRDVDRWAAPASASAPSADRAAHADTRVRRDVDGRGDSVDTSALSADRAAVADGRVRRDVDGGSDPVDTSALSSDQSAPGGTPVGRDAERRGDSAGSPVPTPTPALDPDLVALRWYAAVAERMLEAVVEPGLDQDDRRRATSAQPAEHAAEVAALGYFGSAEEAVGWGEVELENIVALVERNADTADAHRAAWLSVLARLLFPYVQRSGHVAEMEVLGRAALKAARRLGDAPAEAYALGDLAGLYFLTGRQKDALVLTDQALEIWRRVDVVSRIRRCLNNRGLLLEGLGRFAESGEALRQSLAYSRQLNDPYGEAVTHSHLGNLYEHTDPRAAIEQHRRSLAIGDAIGAVIVQHSAHCNIGYAHLALGEPAAAAGHFEESLRILGGAGDWHGESQTRLGLVRALRQLGETGRASGECAELLQRADARADAYMGALARHQHGLLLREQGRRAEAYDAWRAALAALDGTDEQTVLGELRALLAEDRPHRTKAP
ncbi:BTAD domain-containing putative transcriptional regulator [Streptomyces sp. MMG1121]|uniref:BTAD domain-containing putative transcriptional regulator n=1 Tax=Streptomyces sp. MMG1121 TaxID=1415544 RepID=UPI0006AF66A9|nr:BTAD domain-containing putative transcriptional regulator [Streptomyces sp. MMG1121]KOV68410.1 transcriptional regulator [Streptomyces sp. MMG1121]